MLQEILTKIGFDWKLAISHFVNLMILFGIIGYFILPKLKQTLAERTQKIADGIRKSEESEKVLLNAEVKSENILQNARIEQSKILSLAEEKGKNIIFESEVKAGEINQKANDKFQNSEKLGFESGLKNFEEMTPSFLKTLAIKAFEGKITPEINNAFIKKITTSS
jgi:F0F1-type ATP synthase membrane subunit b/b'